MDRSSLQLAVLDDLTQREMSNKFNCSQTTIRYWLNKFELKTHHSSHRKRNGPDDPRYIQRECKYHGVTEYILEPSRNAYRCKRCRSGKVSEQRRALKRRLVLEAGGQCIRCAYNRSIWSLGFHHRNPLDKKQDIGNLIRDRKYEAAKVEVLKCDLVCSNCHGELEEEKWQQGSAV